MRVVLAIIIALSLVSCSNSYIGAYVSEKIKLTPKEEKTTSSKWNKLQPEQYNLFGSSYLKGCDYGGFDPRKKIEKLGIYEHSIDTNSLTDVGDTIDHPIGNLTLIKKWSGNKSFFPVHDLVQLTVHDVMIVRANQVSKQVVGSLPDVAIRDGNYFVHIYFTIENKTNEEIFFKAYPNPFS